MKMLFSGIAMLVLAGCATAQSRPEALTGPAEPNLLTAKKCSDLQGWQRWTCIGMDSAAKFYNDAKPGLDALGKIK